MVGDSKILTVSYGTFSCTLEGFDDPFNTMKAIAEYFRDLAEDDRYFGADPPTPDSAMLHRIAEREVSRMVEARVQDKSVFLRQQDAPVATAPVQMTTAVGSTAPDVAVSGLNSDAPAAPAGPMATPAAASAGLRPDLATAIRRFAEAARPGASADAGENAGLPVLHDIIPDGVAAKLARIRQSVSYHPASAFLPAASEPAAPAVAEALADAEVPAVDSADASIALPDTGPEAEPLSEDVAAEFPDEAGSELAQPEAEADTAEVAELIDEPVRQDAVAEDLPEEGGAGDDTAAATVTPPLLRLSGALVEDEVSSDGPGPQDAVIAADGDDGLAESADAWKSDGDNETGTEAEPAGSDTPRRAHARVLRIRNTDGGAQAAGAGADDDPGRAFDRAGGTAAMSRLLRQADDEMSGAENRRRLSAIAHLKAAVAATEAEIAVTGEALSNAVNPGPYRDDLAHAVQPEETEAQNPVRPRREIVSERPAGPRPGTIRPGMMTVPPLVLVSEQRIDRTPPAGQPMVAVRQGRLSGAIGASAASLHAATVEDAQHVNAIGEFDEEDEAESDNIFSDDAGFARFIEKLGVTSLTEQLEAAAAFATIVENRNFFTRPQLMRRLSGGTKGNPVTREDGLRSFGALLRTGRIEKVRRGQYALSASSPYLAEARSLAL